MPSSAHPRSASPNTSIRWRNFLWASAAGHFVFFALIFSYRWLDDVVNAEGGTFLRRFIEECTGTCGSFLLSSAVFLMWRHMPLRGGAFWRRTPWYLVLGLILSAGNTSFMWGSRSVIFPLVGLGSYDYGRMPLRYLMEVPSSLIGFAMIVGAMWLATEIADRREQAIAHTELERAYADSHLRSLRLQLQPHFLFNALNTIAAQLHDDPRGADRLIGRLSELLRSSFRATDVLLVPLRDEMALLDAYVDLMRARFGDRLDVHIDVDHALHEILVPPLLLQPLVENAVRHGGLERDGHARITVAAQQRESRLILRVHDDGPGAPAELDPLASGTGLSTTARRVALLYPDAAALIARNGETGGFEVIVTLPIRTT